MGLDPWCLHFPELQLSGKMIGTFILGRRKYVTVQVEKIYSAKFFSRVLLIYMHERQVGSTNKRQRVSSLGVSACKLIAQARNILHHKFSPKVLYKVELHIQVICSKLSTYKEPFGLTRNQQPLWLSGRTLVS